VPTTFDAIPSQLVWSRRQLLAEGATGRSLTAAVRDGLLIRPRQGLYVSSETDPEVVRAVRVGGLCACITAGAHYGLWVTRDKGVHIWTPRSRTHLRSPSSSRVPLTPRNREGCLLHWRALIEPENCTDSVVSIIDCLAQIVQCQEPRFAIAAIDSALNKHLISKDGLRILFDSLPGHLAQLEGMTDGAAESGLESLTRLALVAQGWRVESQVQIAEVGRVDLLVNGSVVVETDGREYHEGWANADRDRSRDLALAAQGVPTIRPVYRHVLAEMDKVVAAVAGLLSDVEFRS
jgi:very-short-patch-repair endonuclease